jgi:hypothetical protein
MHELTSPGATSNRNVADLAQHVEPDQVVAADRRQVGSADRTAHGKPAGWLDEARESDSVAPAEKAFLDLALKAWRATNSAGRKALREQMKLVAGLEQASRRMRCAGKAAKRARRDTGAWHWLPPGKSPGLPMCCLDVGADGWGTSKPLFVSVRNWPAA